VIFDFEAAGADTVRVERRGTGLVLNGRAVDADATRTGAAWSVLIEGRSYEVWLLPTAPGELIAHVNGRSVVVRGGARRFGASRGAAAGASGASGTQPHRVVAPMPGRVTRVLVKVGDVVPAWHGLIVIEAMKMENELRSPRAGVITEIRASEGALVDASAVLLVIE
jgi:biotin carboxyl carrier protein